MSHQYQLAEPKASSRVGGQPEEVLAVLLDEYCRIQMLTSSPWVVHHHLVAAERVALLGGQRREGIDVCPRGAAVRGSCGIQLPVMNNDCPAIAIDGSPTVEVSSLVAVSLNARFWTRFSWIDMPSP